MGHPVDSHLIFLASTFNYKQSNQLVLDDAPRCRRVLCLPSKSHCTIRSPGWTESREQERRRGLWEVREVWTLYCGIVTSAQRGGRILCILQSPVGSSRMTARQTDRKTGRQGDRRADKASCLSAVVCSCCGVCMGVCVCVSPCLAGPAVIISDHNKSWQCAKWVHGRFAAPFRFVSFRFCCWHTYFSVCSSSPLSSFSSSIQLMLLSHKRRGCEVQALICWMCRPADKQTHTQTHRNTHVDLPHWPNR